MQFYILFFLGGYLVGSLPTAYILVRIRSKIDIRGEGSGNVGGYNTFIVTGSKWLGVVVGVVDALKGAAAVALAMYFADNFWLIGISLLGAIIGHNYPVWLKFKGGRGLATAGGGLLLIGLGYGVVWCFLWLALKLQGREILTSNVFAILLAPLAVLLLPKDIIQFLMTSDAPVEQYRTFSIILSLLLLLSHINGFGEVLQDLRSVGSGRVRKK